MHIDAQTGTAFLGVTRGSLLSWPRHPQKCFGMRLLLRRQDSKPRREARVGGVTRSKTREPKIINVLVKEEMFPILWALW